MKFKPEDFGVGSITQTCADIANAKLAEWLKDAPEVLSCKFDCGCGWPKGWRDYNDNLHSSWYKNAKKAKLVCVEKIKEGLPDNESNRS